MSATPSGRLRGRRILITGAASGIGRGTAELFAAEGAALTLLDCNGKGLAEVARETRGISIEADVTREASVARAVEQGAAAMGGIDGVVNAAGIVIHGSVLDVGVADWQLVLEADLTGTYIVVRCCLPWLAKASFATIVNIASGQGLPSGYFLRFRSHSMKCTATVDRQCSAGDKGRRRPGQKQDGLRNLQRVRYALQRVPIWLPLKARNHRGIYHTGTYTVDANGRC